MTGSLTLDQPLADCTVGESKEITVRVTPTQNDDKGFAADVEEVVDYEEEKPDVDKEEMAGGGMEKEMPETMKKGMASKAPAVAIVMMGGKKK